MASAQVTITQLPAAGPLTGDELVPIVQNGQTVQTTTGDIAVQPTQTQTFLTVDQEPSLPNSQYLAVGSGLSLTDNGAQGTLQVNITGTAASLNSSGNGLIAKTATNTITPREIEVGTGLTIADGNGVAANPTVGLGSFLSSVQSLSGSTGLVGVSGGAATARSITGTGDQISVSNGDGSAGNPTVGLASNPVLPGVGGTKVPTGTTAERLAGVTNGTIRYNTDTQLFEGYLNGAWTAFASGSGVTSITAGTGLTGGTITSTGTIGIDTSVVATLDGIQTLTNKTISGSSNTLSNIGNSSLTYSSITLNGTPVSLGGSATITAVAPYTLTLGTGLSGTSYNGSASVTAAIANTGVTANTYGSASAVPVFAVNAQGQLTSVTNTNISIASSAITDKGLAGGVASLDGAGTVPTSQLPASVIGGVSYQGAWNASTNTPTLASGVGTKGYYYVVDVAGSTNLDGITDWKVGDWAIFNGTVWQKIDNTESVISVNGYTGVVALTYSDVGAPSTSGTGATGTWGISISGNANTATTATTATNVAGGGIGSLVYQTGSSTTSTLALGGTNYVLTAGASAPQYTAQSSLSVGTATNIAGGIASQIPYQTGAGATSFIANGTAGQVLTSAGTSAPTWSGINGGTF